MQRYSNLFKREIHGVLLLDKPSGFSSSFISYKIKKFFCAKKAGHAGTLDPIATGMLPICFGKATKLVQSLLYLDKKYKVFAKLGESTDTYDADGLIMRMAPIQFDSKKLEECLNSFRGKIDQLPPMFSSLKYRGLPLYKYARKGVSIPRKTRIIYIYDLYCFRKGLSIIELDVKCSKGTYIRSLINDLGECLGCGAHVIGLRRLMIGNYLPSSMIDFKKLESLFFNKDLDDLEVLNTFDTFLIPIDSLNS